MFTKGALTRLGFAFAVFFSAIFIACSPAFGQAEFREPVNDERNPGRGSVCSKLPPEAPQLAYAFNRWTC